ncbi:MAG: lytic transglycosylase domain-containing protein [Taibaiella sp.]|jgi:hypothetical protein
MMARYAVDDNLLSALIKQESGGNNNAVSSVGARGVTQVMPKTARDPGFGVKPMRNNSEEEYRRFGRDYLGAMLDRYDGDLNKALAAYNAGPGTVDKAGGVPNIPETQNYVKNILKTLNPIGEASASERPYAPKPLLSREQFNAMKAQSSPKKLLSREEFYAARGIKPEQPGIMERAGKNLPQDLTNIGEGIINIGAHPIESAKNLAAVARGGMQSALPDEAAQYLIDKGITPESRPQFEAFAEPLVNTVLHPVESFANAPASTILNVAGLASAGTGLTKAALGKATANAAQADIANVARQNALNSPKRAVLEAGQKAGFVVPKSEVAPSFINNRLEGVAGKAALNQESILRNQAATTAQARKAIGIADDVPITGNVIDKAIKAQYKPYEDIAALPTRASQARGYSVNTHTQTNSGALLEELKQARHDSQAWYKTAEMQGGNPEMVAKAKALSNRAKAIELEFENRAIAAGKPELVPQLREARTNIAKIYSVDKARNVATGEIDPRVIGAQYDKAPKKITGELKQIGEFQQAFPKYAKAGEGAQTPGVSKIEAVTSIGGGMGGAALGGPLGGFVGAMLPLASTPVRSMLLSKWYQNKLLDAMTKNPSKIKTFMNKSTNKTVSKNALIGLIASDKEQR